MLKVPRMEEGTKEKKRKGGEKKGKKEEEKCKETQWVGIMGKKKKVCEKK